MRLALASFAFVAAACDLSGGERADTGVCPESVCSDTTPEGLHFYGDEISAHDWLSDLFIDGPAPTAKGGHQTVRITGLYGAPFEASTDSATGIAVDSTDHSAESVVLRGTGNGSDYLRIVDPSDGALYDRKKLDGAAIERIAIEPIQWEVGTDQPWVFKGQSTVAVALYGQVIDNGTTYNVRLVDTTMTIELPANTTRTAWDAITIPATASTLTVGVTAGDAAPASLDVTVVDHIDGIEADQVPTSVAVNEIVDVCFHGLAQGRPVAGLAWSFTLNGGATGGLAPNCVLLQATAVGPLDIVAMTEGMQTSVHIDVVEAAQAAPVAAMARRRTVSSDGERAAPLQSAGD